MSEYKEEIKQFILDLQQKAGTLPKFCHNLVNKDPKKVYYSGAYFDENELVAAIDALLFGRWSSSGEICAQFEREFSKKINQKYSFFTNSGSSANLLLIAACKEYYGWKDGGEIIVSCVGFPTTISAIVQNGLKPVFVDIEWETLNFDLNKVQEKITNKTRAIFLSPVLGNPPNISQLCSILNHCKFFDGGAKYTDIHLLLDNCDSLGSKWMEIYLNKYATASSCSFYPAHEITTLEGGMVSSDVEEIVKLARSYATWGRDCYCIGTNNLLSNGTCGCRFSDWIKEFPDLIIDHKYVFNRIGWNLKPLDLCGAIGLEQLKKLDFILETRKNNCKIIGEILRKHVKYIEFPRVLEETDWCPFGVPIIIKDKEKKMKLVSYLESKGVQTRNYFAGNLLMHKGYSHLDNFRNYPEANKVLDYVFFIGCAPTISKANLEYIDNILKDYD